MFKLLAIRPLEGCASHIQKCLKTGMMYYFCNDYIIEPESHIRRRSKNIKPLKEDFFTVVSESDYSEDNSSGRKSPTVSVSAIVGKNGDGKSTLVELMMRLINNCAISYKLSASSDSLRRVKDVKAELYYMVDNVVYRMAEEEEEETWIWKMTELDDNNGEMMRWEMKPKKIEHVDKDSGCFFFTIVSNYSHYAYNIYDYEKEWEIRGDEKDDDEKCWLHYIFHKNDGYLTPITLHPLRYKGNIDINNEKWLSKQRMLSLFLNADNPAKKEHSFRRVNSKDANVLKLTEETESKLQQNAIIDYFKTVGDENKFYDLIQKMVEIDESINENEGPFMVLQKKNEDWLVKFNDLVDNTLPLYFIDPIKQIIEQDADFGIFVSEVIGWLNTIGDGVVHSSGDIGLVIDHFFNLYEKVKNVQTQRNSYNKMEYEDGSDKSAKVINLNSEAYVNRGNANYKLGDFDAAIWDYGRAINLNPKNAEAYINRGNANFKIGDFDAAIWDYGKAINLNPNNAEAYIKRGNANCKIGNYGTAIWDYGKAINLDPKNAEAYFCQGSAYYQKNDFHAAKYEYDIAINIKPRFENAYINRGSVNCKIGDYGAAILDFCKAINLNPENIEMYIYRGNAYFQMGDYGAAIWDYGKAINLNPKNSELYFNLGNIYYKKGDYHAAIYEYDIAINIKSSFEEVYHNRGNAYFYLGDYAKAISDYSKEIALYPMNAEAYFNRGNAYFNKGDYNKAIDDYDKAIKFPANKGSYVRIIEDNEEWLEGLNFLSANAYNNRGNAYFKMRSYNNALFDYSTAIKLNSRIPEAYYNRCRIYAILDKNLAMKKDYAVAIILNPQYAEEVRYVDLIRYEECKQVNNVEIIQLLRIMNSSQGDEGLHQTIWQIQGKTPKELLYSLESIKEKGVNNLNAAQLGILDTLYRIMKSYSIDWKIVTKNYSDLSLEKKCQHYIVYKTWSILSTYPQYQKAYKKDSIESIRGCGAALEECIEEIKKDGQSHVTRKLRQVKHFMDEEFQDGSLYERLGKKEKDTGDLLIGIDELKKHYEGKFLSLDNLPPSIYKWDILFNRKEDPAHCDIGLDSFSSGEKQKLNLIGAIVYHLQNLAHTASEVKYNNVNLIMEEIELYYHPEYQKQFFKELLIRIKGAELGNIQNINIFFVTHSPFILSDIPKCNVLFLKDGMPDDELQENTFGANIHSLLKHGFFMPNLPIGEFAYEKINALFKKLNTGDFNNDDEEKRKKDLNDIYQQILLVGEPFLRNQLLLLYNSFKGSK